MPNKTFENIAPAKRERILRQAALFFAERGYVQTDMAELARRCDISKGSIYTYFDSKEALYLHVCRDGLERSRKAVWADVEPDWDIYRLVEHVFERGVGFARRHPEYVTLYLSFAPPGMEVFAEELSREVETPTAETLKERIRDGIGAGIVRPGLDVNQTAWVINNAYVMLLAALVSRHFRTRLAVYCDVDDDLTDAVFEQQTEQSIRMIQDILRPEERT